jgi:hypothetical protein
MLELKDVEGRFGLSEHQARRLLRALEPVLQGRVKRGRDNRLLLSDDALAILERAVGLWRDGLPLRDLGPTVAAELGNGAPCEHNGAAQDHAKPPSDHCPACQVREELIRELRADKERLLQLLEDAQAQVRAMLPPPRRSLWARLFRR